MAAVGAVLCGGASRRMGRDKALVTVDGVALARRVADALVAGGCERVVAVGGDRPALEALGLPVVADRWPGEGPLGGLVTALGVCAEGDVVVVAPCDWLHPSALVVETLVREVGAMVGDDLPVEVAYPWVDGRGQWLPSAWLAGSQGAADVQALFDAGERRLEPAVDAVVSILVPLAEVDVADADTPADLGDHGPG